MTQFITAEGGEGSGKTTHMARLASHLIRDGYKVKLTRDPGGSEIGLGIRPLLLDKKYGVSREAEFLLYLASRAELVNKIIKPIMERGDGPAPSVDFILCDRFYDSTAVYQGVIRGWNNTNSCDNCQTKELLEDMHRIFCDDIQPDLTFLFDVNPVLGLNRSKGEEKSESRWEEEGLVIHTKINSAFMDLAEMNEDRIIVIDANQEEDDVFSEMLGHFYREIL
jgi:dTMP kinase